MNDYSHNNGFLEKLIRMCGCDRNEFLRSLYNLEDQRNLVIDLEEMNSNFRSFRYIELVGKKP